MRRFYPVKGKSASLRRERCADSSSGRRRRKSNHAELCAALQRKSRARRICVSQCDATPRLSGAATAEGNYFGASEATIFSKRGSPRSGSQKGNSFKAPELSTLTDAEGARGPASSCCKRSFSSPARCRDREISEAATASAESYSERRERESPDGLLPTPSLSAPEQRRLSRRRAPAIVRLRLHDLLLLGASRFERVRFASSSFMRASSPSPSVAPENRESTQHGFSPTATSARSAAAGSRSASAFETRCQPRWRSASVLARGFHQSSRRCRPIVPFQEKI